MSQLYAEINTSGTIVNLVQWDGVSTFNVSPNILVNATGQPNAQIGGTYSNGVFTAPSNPAAAQGIIFANSPTSGSSLQLPLFPRPQNVLYAYLEPASTLASLTLLMPASPQDGDVLNLLSSQAITSLSFSPTFQGAPTSLAATSSGAKQFTYSAQLGNWFIW